MYVFDTNVFVAALRSRSGASFQLLQVVLGGGLAAAASNALMFEYEDVLTRRENQDRFWATPQQVGTVLHLLAARMNWVEISFRWRPQLRDADDELVLECAVNACARAIVTFNRADFIPEASRFGISVIAPAQLLRQVGRGWR